MSRYNAALALPAGDRDSPPALEAEPVAGGETKAAKPDGLLPATALTIATLETILDEAVMTLGDIKLERSQKRWPAFEASAYRLASLSMHLAKTITANRPREKSK